jgi:type IV secretory pathway VirB2 component (pilin)
MANKSASDFAHFYATSLLRELKELDKVRKSVLGKVKILIAVTGGIVLTSAVIDVAYEFHRTMVLVTAVICFAAGSFLYKFLISGYVEAFKVRVIKKIVEFVDPALTYWPYGHISAVQFNSSRIFERYPDRMTGGDLVQGEVGLTRIEFSEVHAEQRSETTDNRGRHRASYSTVFKGLFFLADFNKKFYGKTVVLPDTAERLLGGIGSFLQSMNRSRGELVKIEDPEFERYFVVYGDDQIESRYVLSPSLVRRILNFRKKTGKRMYLSFVGSQVFVAVAYRRPLFEPKVFSSITGFNCVKEYFQDLELALGMVDDLNLNTRIWSKARSPL